MNLEGASMQPKTLAATRFAPMPVARLSSLALPITAFVIATFLAIVLVAKVEAVSYRAGVVAPDVDAVFQTMIVSP
jgi:hypothetical protein